jgi:hypothetical protein
LSRKTVLLFSSSAEKNTPILPEKSSAAVTVSVKGKGYREGHPTETHRYRNARMGRGPRGVSGQASEDRPSAMFMINLLIFLFLYENPGSSPNTRRPAKAVHRTVATQWSRRRLPGPAAGPANALDFTYNFTLTFTFGMRYGIKKT